MVCIEPTAHKNQAHPQEPGQPYPPSRRWNLPLLLLVLVAVFLAGASLAVLITSRPPGNDSPEAGFAHDMIRPPENDSPEAGFARDMMVHHAQAVQTAEIVRFKTESEEIRTLATDIALTQQAQIGMMQGWLQVWGLSPTGTEPAMSWMGHPTEGPMPGMATPEEINRLSDAAPEEADEQFLWLMIRHHRAAIPMAEAILKRTDRPEVRQLAEAIAASQRQEIRTMKAMSEELMVNFARIHLEPVGDSGVSGTATFEVDAGGVRVELDIEGLPRSGATYLAHVHPGSCTKGAEAGGHERKEDHQQDQEEVAHEEGHGGHMNTGEPMGKIEAPLTPVESDSKGSGSSTTVLNDASVDGLFSGEPEHVNVHAAGSGNPSPLACADL
jgi:uncharacterized protein (DUF305 family)